MKVFSPVTPRNSLDLQKKSVRAVLRSLLLLQALLNQSNSSELYQYKKLWESGENHGSEK